MEERAERLYQSEHQEVCCEIISPRNERKALPLIHNSTAASKQDPVTPMHTLMWKQKMPGYSY